jgi:hypothetical protein
VPCAASREGTGVGGVTLPDAEDVAPSGTVDRGGACAASREGTGVGGVTLSDAEGGGGSGGIAACSG